MTDGFLRARPRTGRRVGGFLLALLLTSPAASRAQGTVENRLAGRLDSHTVAELSAVIDSMAVLGVPGEPLVAKALEGASKQATGERIVVAVRNLARDLRSARSALGASASEAEVGAGASALRAGVPVAVIARVKAACRTPSALLPLATLADLVTQGMSVDHASARILSLAEHGATDDDYRSMIGGAPPASPPGGTAVAPAGAHPPTPPTGSPSVPPARGRPAERP